MEDNFMPLGLRVLIKKIDNPLQDFGKDIYEGTIIQVPSEISSIIHLTMVGKVRNAQQLNEDYKIMFGSCGTLKVGTKVRFKYNQEIVDKEENVYNVPIELIRSYEVR